MLRLASSAACLAVVLFYGAPLAAQPRVAVEAFDGPLAGRARNTTVEVLANSGCAIVPQQDVQSAATAAGADLATPDGRVAVARELQINAFVGATIQKHGGTLQISFEVFDGATGASVAQASLRAPKAALPRKLRSRLVDELGGALASAAAPPPVEQAPVAAPPAARVQDEPKPAPRASPQRARKPAEHARPAEPATPAAPADEPEREGAAKRPLPKALELRLGARVLTRTFRYVDALVDLTEHTLAATPAGELSLRWYPGAHFTSGLGADFGLEASGLFMYPVDAERDAIAYPTKSLAFGAALHVRIPLGKHQLGVLAGYGRNTFALDRGADGSDPGLPSVDYGFVRFGLDGRVMLSDAIGIAARAGYRLLNGYGDLADDLWFSRASGGGLEAELGLRVNLLPILTLDAGGGLTRYFLTLDPDPSDPGVTGFGRIAGGAVDQQLYGTLGLTLAL